MKWLIAALLLMITVASSQTIRCSTVEFYGLGMTIFNPSERHVSLVRWLDFNGPKCSKDDLVLIWNNLPSWAGTADSAEIRVKIIILYQQLVEKENTK
jgi:hypothetical protein